MTAPLVDALALSPAAALGAALAIGIAFGWCLERAGLGSAPRLAAQFYLRDLTVFKVMFSAIVTAMLGTSLLARLGWLDLSRVYVPETFLLPQLAGGVVFGVGFAIAGLCPGTSCVAAATGRGDGLAVAVGMFAGVVGTGLAFDRLRAFYEATARGTLTLPDVFHVNPGTVMLGITVAAVGGSIVASRLERRSVRSRAGRFLAAVALALATLAALSAAPQSAASRLGSASERLAARGWTPIDPVDVAARIKRRDPGLRILDVRAQEAFDAYHVPTARRAEQAEIAALTTGPSDVVIIYGDQVSDTERAAALLAAAGRGQVNALDGGMAGWMSKVMMPVVAPDATAEEKAAFARVAALSRYFGGSPRVRTPDARSSRVSSDRRRDDAPVAPFAGQPVSALSRWRRGC